MSKIDSVQITAKWVIPEAFKQPSWVDDNLKKFKDETKIIINKKLSKKEENDQIKKLLEKYIFGDKVKPKYPLNKGNLGKTVTTMFENIPQNEFIYRYWMLQEVGFFLSTFKPSGFAPEALSLPDKFKKKKDELLKEYQGKVKEFGKENAIAWIDKEFDKLTDEVIDYWESEGINIVDMIRSKARGGPSDIRKMLVAVGLSINTAGEINDVIMTAQIDGLEQTQFFNYSSQAI